MSGEELLVSAALSGGADKATIIERDGVVMSRSFRAICENNTCGAFNRCWVCPPDAGDIDVLMQRVRSFSHALWYQTIGTLEDSFDYEGMVNAAKRHERVCIRVRELAGRYIDGEYMSLSAGGCHLCGVCAKLTGEPCRHPEDAMLSVECCGVDVYNTTKNTPLRYINGKNSVTYFGAVFYNSIKDVTI